MTKTALAANGPLDWLNFLLADVTGGAGPFLAIYLMASQQWSAGRIGIAASAPERVAGADGAGRCAAHDDPRRHRPICEITRNSVDSLPQPL